VDRGMILLDGDLRVRAMNRTLREEWRVPPAAIAKRPPLLKMLTNLCRAGAIDTHGLEPEVWAARRMEEIASDNPPSRDVRTSDGRVIRSHVHLIPGGRMLSYTDITDLVRQAEEAERKE